ncbi:MAG: ferredoxin, partial [Acidobacteria bacterium]|nr:ferredoxin [Acidobacteriota bacterium]
QFRTVPRDAWNDNMIPLVEYLELDGDDREGKFPFIWAVNRKNRLIRVVPAAPLVRSCEDRRHFWRMLKSLSGLRPSVDTAVIAEQARSEFAQSIAAQLIEMAASGNILSGAAPKPIAAAPTTIEAAAPVEAQASTMPWIETALCTSCDECTRINKNIFAYNENKQAFIKNPKGGPYRDLVRAAEKCTASIIHPGLPLDPTEKELDKLVKRAAKYN